VQKTTFPKSSKILFVFVILFSYGPKRLFDVFFCGPNIDVFSDGAEDHPRVRFANVQLFADFADKLPLADDLKDLLLLPFGHLLVLCVGHTTVYHDCSICQ